MKIIVVLIMISIVLIGCAKTSQELRFEIAPDEVMIAGGHQKMTGEQWIILAFEKFDEWRTHYLEEFPEAEELPEQELINIYWEESKKHENQQTETT